ncbi:MAG TPA: AAA family ATPase [Longimicrobiales bacterium]|nr:AAA family ATPase [Longimicrobiales bacterium]
MNPEMLDELDVLLRTRYGLILIETAEEERAASLLRHAAARRGLPLFVWSRTRGLRRDDLEAPVYDTQAPEKALAHIDAGKLPALYHMPGIADTLADDRALAARVADAARAMSTHEGALVLTAESASLPPQLRAQAALLSLAAPGAADYRALLQGVLHDVAQRMHVRSELDPAEQEQLLANLQGLTLMEAEKLLTRAIVEDGRLNAADIREVMEAKKRVVEREGLLEYYPTETPMSQVADLAGLKKWLAERRAIVHDSAKARSFGLEFPRGMLLLGVPGCGKSLCAKAVAWDWGLPLLKLDTANLYHKYVGESERNFKRAMQTAERMAPVVLWIDELEKAFAAGGEDGGVSQRVLGGFLSWMQDRTGDVFVVATANDVARLPAEFLRKGRFDEIFFVDLPDEATRAEIFRIHLERRNQPSHTFDVAALAAASPDFSGAEIEQVVVSAMYAAFAAERAADTAALAAEIAATRPLAVTMAERVAAMREWARERTRPAN